MFVTIIIRFGVTLRKNAHATFLIAVTNHIRFIESLRHFSLVVGFRSQRFEISSVVAVHRLILVAVWMRPLVVAPPPQDAALVYQHTQALGTTMEDYWPAPVTTAAK